jgi:hypothetical protein
MNRSYLQVAFWSVVAILFTSCAHIPTQFGGSWPLPAEHRSSAAIDLGRPVVEPLDRGLRVTGYLSKQPNAVTTVNSHVDVQCVDAGGTVLTEQSVAFVPGDLAGGSLRSRPAASYEVTLATLPAGTARIRVVAHDRPHGT